MIKPRRADDPEQAINAALDARDAGRAGDAVPLLRAALAIHPRNPRLWQTLGGIYRALEESAAAIEAFAEAARLSPGDLKPAYGMAQASLEAGRAAVALFDQARLLAPGDGSLLIGRAAAQMAEGRANVAIAELDAVVGANPTWIEGQSTLARLRWQMGDGDGFANGYVRALRAEPGAARLWIELINLLLHVERYADAAAAIADAMAAIGAIDALLPLRATVASEMGEWELADRMFARLANVPDMAIAERHVRHLLRTGRPDLAAARAEPLLDDPQAGQIWPYVALAWRLTGDPRHLWLEGDAALVGVTDLDVGALLEPLAERLRAIHRASAAPLGQSVRGGTQTDGPLFAREEPEIRRLRAAIADAVQTYIAGLGAREAAHPTRRHAGRGFRFAGSWSVRLAGAGHHSNHIHPLGWISSAFYVSLPSPREMGAAPAGWLQLGAPPAELGLDLSAFRTVEARPGRLVLFPSIMWHGTLPFAAGERLTVSFDVVAAA